MKRILQIAKELNISVATATNYCDQLGQKIESVNSKIDPQLETHLIAVHEGMFDFNKKKSKDFELITIKELPQEFNFHNPFEAQQQEILLENDLFVNRQIQSRTFEGTELNTIFTDFEAFSICLGLENRHLKKIARKYFKTQHSNESELIEVHNMAMATLEKYGSKMLSFIISLPPLPFKSVNVLQMFSELDKGKKKQDFPILRIAYKNEKNQAEKINISYYSEKIESRINRYDNILTIKSRKTGQTIMKVSRSGIVIPENNAKQIIPVLQVFMRFASNTMQTLLNYGLETGECSICGRKLTDSESIKIGMGPVCRQFM